MGVVGVLRRSIEAGVFLYLENDRLKYKVVEGGNFTSELKDEVGALKNDIISYLRSDIAQLKSARIQPRLNRSDACALSFAQQRLWMLDNIESGGNQYNMPMALELAGELD